MAFFAAIAAAAATISWTTVAINVAIAVGLQILSNVLGPGVSGPRLSDLTVTTSTYGTAIPRVFGERMRLAGNVIWSTGLIEHRHKKGGFLTPKVTTYTYTVSLAVAICERTLAEGPVEAIEKIIANGKVVWDATLGGSVMGSVVAYLGDFTQLPDPTIEAAVGVGQTPAYRGTVYIAITDWLLTDYGNRVPNIEVLMRAKTGQTLAEVADTICAAAGIDNLHNLSTTQLANQTLAGYALGSPMNCWDALKPLQAAYNFEAAEQQGQIRFLRRAQNMAAVIPAEDQAAYAAGDRRPAANAFSRDVETALPREVSINFLDPARDYQPNSQSEKRVAGSAESNISMNLPLALTADQGRAIAGRILWEQWAGRAGDSFTLTDRWIGLEAGRVYGIETRAGVRPYRITRRTRGANGIIEVEALVDESLAYTFDPTGAAAATPANAVALPGPVNPPTFVELNAELSKALFGLTSPGIAIAISGGDGTTFDPAWKGAEVWLSTDNFVASSQLVGSVPGPATMGKLTAGLASYGGANPDAVHTLSVTTLESGEPLASVPAADAARGDPIYYVGGELMGVQTVTATAADAYDLTDLYRGLLGSSAGAHSLGDPFVLLDAAVFILANRPDLVGKTLYFRFVGIGETLASVVTYTFTPTGIGFGGAGSGSGSATPASEDLPLATGGSGGAAGGYCLVNIWDASGVAKLRLADNTILGRPCHGFLNAALGTGDSGVPYFSGQISGLSGLTAGVELFLGEDGELTATRPTASGARQQVVAIATGPTTADFRPQTPSLTDINP